MGATYANLTTLGPAQHQLVKHLGDREALVSPTESGATVILDQAIELGLAYEIITVSAAISMEFRCPVLAVRVYDDDMLAYWLHKDGRLLDWYNTFSGETGAGQTLVGPSGGDAKALASAFGRGDQTRLGGILRARHADYVTESSRHSALVTALGLPGFAVGLGFGYFCSGSIGRESLPKFVAIPRTAC